MQDGFETAFYFKQGPRGVCKPGRLVWKLGTEYGPLERGYGLILVAEPVVQEQSPQGIQDYTISVGEYPYLSHEGIEPEIVWT